MAGITIFRIFPGVVALAFLTACMDSPAGIDRTDASRVDTRARTGGEVEVPEVFQATASALWDGRPSLGGTWVASPDAVDPERVLMFNPANGKSVKGALFRRERENPGPPLQLSSDAAEALGILAGMPTEIRVTALRKPEAGAAPDNAKATDQITEGGQAAVNGPPQGKTGKEKGTQASSTVNVATAAIGQAGAAAMAPAGDPPAKTAMQTIQVATFAKEENANGAVADLGKIGISARAAKSDKAGRAVWSVIATGDADLLKKIKAAGFADAYFLS